MDSRLQPLLQNLALSERLFDNALDGLSEQDCAAHTNPRGNSLRWIAGHIVFHRFALARVAGVAATCPFSPEHFGRGAKLQPEEDYPSMAEILDTWRSITAKLKQRLNELSPQEIEAPLPLSYPVAQQNVLHGLWFLSWHEAYHVGQMGYVRRLLDHDRVAG